MNYRAWNHRCWLISYTTNEQVLYEMKQSRSWAALHVSDNCCFHYRSWLLQKIAEDQSYAEETASYGHNADIVQVVKDKLDWNETLIKRYFGRENAKAAESDAAQTYSAVVNWKRYGFRSLVLLE
ncbi:unnamed protein product [Trifolium pratense]|uniref:Uncharacterized protein n=1 Tax=Trifolium pratense TaxID=57577 RepID=A0ACB0JI97_TRIPR|nr:unnamed protein product [Trifolium pratense]